jgi:hypothetical protein
MRLGCQEFVRSISCDSAQRLRRLVAARKYVQPVAQYNGERAASVGIARRRSDEEGAEVPSLRERLRRRRHSSAMRKQLKNSRPPSNRDRHGRGYGTGERLRPNPCQ